MRTRHRIPTIFNLSMVDVLCCALGCVILLWLLNLRAAKEETITAGKTWEQLQATQTQLEATASQLSKTTSQRDQLQRDLQAERSQFATLEQELAHLRADKASTDDRLVKLSRQQQALVKEKAKVSQQLLSMDKLLSEKERQAKLAAGRIKNLEAQLQDAETKAKELRALADLVPGLRADVQSYRAKLAVAEANAEGLERATKSRAKDLADTYRRLTELQDQNKRLADRASRALAAAENRFEGIALTGRRVLFLVDMSGSMELVDERTPDLNKWVGVRETLAKIMRSLPDLEKFQVLIFSNRVSYLIGNDGLWLDYDAKSSVDRVAKALSAIQPLGSTNMYDAFETAFRFRAAGLDTIYVLSDGLPNAGPGLTAEQMTLTETARSEILARHIRTLLRRDWNRPLPGRSRVRINTVGFFYESPDVGAFLWALARENEGSFVGMSKP